MSDPIHPPLSPARHLRSFVLPITVTVLVPFLLIGRFNPLGLEVSLPLPVLQLPLGALFLCLGLTLLVMTIRMFARLGRGTLAPWDPTHRLVTEGVYGYTRNPMISGVLLILIGEAILLGSREIAIWALIFLFINMLYFKVYEEPGLVKRFGEEYRTYRAHVPMWLPRLTPWRDRR